MNGSQPHAWSTKDCLLLASAVMESLRSSRDPLVTEGRLSIANALGAAVHDSPEVAVRRFVSECQQVGGDTWAWCVTVFARCDLSVAAAARVRVSSRNAWSNAPVFFFHPDPDTYRLVPVRDVPLAHNLFK